MVGVDSGAELVQAEFLKTVMSDQVDRFRSDPAAAVVLAADDQGHVCAAVIHIDVRKAQIADMGAIHDDAPQPRIRGSVTGLDIGLRVFPGMVREASLGITDDLGVIEPA